VERDNTIERPVNLSDRRSKGGRIIDQLKEVPATRQKATLPECQYLERSGSRCDESPIERQKKNSEATTVARKSGIR